MVYCILAYPVLVHLSVLTGSPPFAGLALVALYGGFTWPALTRRRPWAWVGLVVAALGSAALVRQGAELYALYLPPILLPAVMALWWAPTLRAGRTPFVTQIATAIRGPLSPEHAAYTRGVTILWVGVFVALALAGAATALWGSAALWSLVTNLLSPLLIGLVFAVEYAYRRHHLRHESHPGFVTFLRQVARAGVRPGSATAKSTQA
jgi:uncharacterized membrane protein